MTDPALVRFRAVVAGALAALEARKQEVNDLNVFPVADGDTGDNMALTLRAVLDELDRLGAEAGQLDQELTRQDLVSSVARAALLGARGNSGVILSQLIRGAAEELASRPGQLVDPALIGAAMARAVERAYASVRDPAEGTMLTVARETAHRLASELAHMPERRLAHDTPADVQDAAIAAALEPALEAARASVRRSPELLPVLRDAGVVDAGGYGVAIIFAGVLAALRGELPELEHYDAHPRIHPHGPHESSTYRYCTNFAITGSGLVPGPFAERLEQIGDSVLVVGDERTLKVHVHTDEPDRATAVFAGAGQVSRLEVADMREQMAERGRRLRQAGSTANGSGHHPCCGAVAVVSGDGLGRLFASLGVHTLDGGPTLNPSTEELLRAIEAVPADEVVVLPNSPNVFMAAERAAEMATKPARVVRSAHQQAGLAAAVELSDERDAAANAAAMDEVLQVVRSGAVAPAARDDVQGRFAAGQAVGFVEDEIVAWGDTADTLAAVLATLSRDAELVTCIAGAGAPLDADEVRALASDGVDLELEDGGQPSYWWLVAAE